MQRKPNEDFIDGYCEKFAAKVSTNFFKSGRQVITGKQILNVTPSKQVNFFVIKLLFRYWQEETKKLESPFFNYKHEEVRSAIVQFMNVLSQHIEIEHERFELLLNHAVKDTIYLAAMPQAYVEIDLDSRGVDQIHDKAIEGTVKYLNIYKKKIFKFLSDMKGLTIDDVVDELPDEFSEFDTTDAVEELCGQLAPILEISIEKIYSEDPYTDDFDEDDLPEPGEEDLVEAPVRPEKTAPEMQIGHTEMKVSVEDNIMKDEEIEEDLFVRPVSKRTEKKERPSESVSSEKEEEEQSPAEHHESRMKDSKILELISINHRYLFIKELFRNDKHEFEQALRELEKYNSFDESVEFLVQSYARHNEWDMQSDEVKEFLKVLFRRFR
ncbi:MAG: hypothetical protein GDA51_03865 [Ekhidna sp.]|nr:hypothetical protein [Ekhidna sp.]MBC6425603.1 hypothetical protein [Ekhidna sp.]